MLRHIRLRRTGLLLAALALLSLGACKSDTADYTPPPATVVTAETPSNAETVAAEPAGPETPGASEAGEAYPAPGDQPPAPEATTAPESYPPPEPPAATVTPRAYEVSQ